MEIKKVEHSSSVSHWEKIGEVYICDKCKHYTDKAESKCPKCKCTMISVVEKVKKD